jgi:predicted enzyme related to lactoylglutathione lyase
MVAIVGRPTSIEDVESDHDLVGRARPQVESTGRDQRAEPVDQGGSPVAWFELWAPDLEPMLRRATELGAVVELHRTNLPSGNAMAIIRDACGNRLGLWAS